MDYETPASAWIEVVLGKLRNGSSPAHEPAAISAAVPAGYSRKNPYPARLLVNRKLNLNGSGKDVRHIEISLAGSGLEYEAGDALGVLPTNCPVLVEEILAALGANGNESVTLPEGGEASLSEALLRNYVITQISPQLFEAVAEKSGDAELAPLCGKENEKARDAWLWGREVIDLLTACPAGRPDPATFVGLLRKVQPRLYSISSSPKAHAGEVHLTIGRVGYDSFGRQRKGVCSTFLSDRVADEIPVPVFVQASKGFRPPVNGDLPVIMVGPGTGIAPFRAFLHERRATGAKGRNWLFFGEQRMATDFYYREEFDPMLADGHLTRLDTAFSRDQAEKIYVQHRMLELGKELWAWLEDGAHFYVCGDASRMAKDVDIALHTILETAGGLGKEEAEACVKRLKTEKRYQRDVY